MNIVVALTGATGAVYGIRLLQYLSQRPDVTTHLILSRWAEETIRHETDFTVEQVLSLADRHYDRENQAAAISSGSFSHDGMVILPCSMKTLSAIAYGLSGELIPRAADVTIKEGRKLILAVRETPLSPIHLENMLKLARLGVTIMPPVPNFYSRPQTLEQLVDAFTGRVLARLGIENDLYTPWEGA